MSEHEIKCESCGQIIDCRDLSQVFAHEFCGGEQLDHSEIENIPSSGSVKIGEPFFFTKGQSNQLGLN